MIIDDLIQQMATCPPGVDDETAVQAFTDAAHRVDCDPAENRRIRGLAELVDADIAAYDKAPERLRLGPPRLMVLPVGRCGWVHAGW